jgi:hypothetical protein
MLHMQQNRTFLSGYFIRDCPTNQGEENVQPEHNGDKTDSHDITEISKYMLPKYHRAKLTNV